MRTRTDPAIKADRIECCLCQCGASGTLEQHEPWCPFIKWRFKLAHSSNLPHSVGTELTLGDWYRVSRIPVQTEVWVLTARGIICRAKYGDKTRWLKRPDKQVPFLRIRCTRLDGNTSGDVMAVGWLPLDRNPLYKADGREWARP